MSHADRLDNVPPAVRGCRAGILRPLALLPSEPDRRRARSPPGLRFPRGCRDGRRIRRRGRCRIVELTRSAPASRRVFFAGFWPGGYHGRVQLHIARLCLDCDEVYDSQTCPICSSESFAYISRWVPAPERRARPRPAPTESRETLDTYRQLLDADHSKPGAGRWLKRGVLGLAAAGLSGGGLGGKRSSL